MLATEAWGCSGTGKIPFGGSARLAWPQGSSLNLCMRVWSMV